VRRSAERGLLARACTDPRDRPGGRDVWRHVLRIEPLQLVPTDRLLKGHELARLDTSDMLFYARPCFVHHTDDAFRARLSALYADTLQEGAHVLDLCSSFSSHLPDDLRLSSCIGVGANEEELRANPALSTFVITDLNGSRSGIPVPDRSIDAVLCCSGFAFLTRPLEVMRECRRILRDDGVMVVSFSSHYYPEKAVVGWIDRDMPQRAELVSDYLISAGFAEAEVVGDVACDGAGDRVGGPGLRGADDASTSTAGGDPFVAVVGRCRAAGDAAARGAARRAAGSRGPLHGVGGAANVVLGEMELRDESGARVSAGTLERWARAYAALADEARAMGIPDHAIPKLPSALDPVSIREARDLLTGIIASRLSSEL